MEVIKMTEGEIIMKKKKKRRGKYLRGRIKTQIWKYWRNAVLATKP